MSSNSIYTPSLEYYVYAYLREDGTPYYIGKGKNNRAFDKHNNVDVPTDESRIIFCETNLTNVGACAIERRLISLWGKLYNNTGILHNISDGGEGNCSTGRISEKRQKITILGKTYCSITEAMESLNISFSHIKFIRENDISRFNSIDEIKEYAWKMRGLKISKNQIYTDERRAKLSEIKKGNTARKGYINSEEHNKKVSAALKGKPCAKDECPHCGKIAGVNVIKRWHYDNCKYRLDI